MLKRVTHSRALGRTSESGEEAASGRTASSKRGYLGSGGGGATGESADERTQLVPSGGGARRGDLESIFARLEAQPVGSCQLRGVSLLLCCTSFLTKNCHAGRGCNSAV